MSTVRIAGNIYHRDEPGWIPDSDNAQRGTYLAESVYEEPGYAVVDHGKGVGFKVHHVASGLVVPVVVPNSGTGRSNGFTAKTKARAFMREIAAAGILPLDRKPTHDEVRKYRDWLVAR